MADLLLEVCIASVQDAINARLNGANRLELNVALELGGLTPTVGLLREVKQSSEIPVIVMIRPRAGGFHYSQSEIVVMQRDAECLLEVGADGIAIGFLTPQAMIDKGLLTRFRRLTNERELVFHRAFDVISDQTAALQQLIDCGVNRVLTSGRGQNAMEGSERIGELQRQSQGRIEILPASGIDAANVADLLRSTGCRQVHGSFRRHHHDPAGPVGPATYPATCPQAVAGMRTALDRLD
jgi:copper homeostasis protein